MKRIILVAMVLLGLLAGLSLLPAAIAGSEKNPSCTTECSSCAERCEKTLAYCQKAGGKHVDPKHLNAIKDCITLCRASEGLMNTGSQYSSKICALCEDVCKKCAESCDSFKGDKAMQACAEECRKCATSCSHMAG